MSLDDVVRSGFDADKNEEISVQNKQYTNLHAQPKTIACLAHIADWGNMFVILQNE